MKVYAIKERYLISSKSVPSYRFKEVIPYPHAKAMLLIDIEDPDKIKEIVEIICRDLRK